MKQQFELSEVLRNRGFEKSVFHCNSSSSSTIIIITIIVIVIVIVIIIVIVIVIIINHLPCTQALCKGSWGGLNFWQLAHKGTREGSTFFHGIFLKNNSLVTKISCFEGKRSDSLTCKFLHKIKFCHFVCIICQVLHILALPMIPCEVPGYKADQSSSLLSSLPSS